MSDPLWYKDAIIYQLHVRSFSDSIGDGYGDFGGLTQKLDYLQDLGITAIWVQPFYPSPQRDDGYDIADYQSINPLYGTLDSFREFLAAAHQRDLKVITELVINHTSDEHPWFQRARRAPPGSPERDFYVWSDTPEKYRDARIIFKDFEPSNWTYDRVAKAYFWHRFYSHQPDLNYDNPEVRQAIPPLLDFWFEMGVDGLRLDAIPYLYEREGTNCENLPETHAYLKSLRRHVDERFPNRMLLAEANQWPEDAVAYFGDGDECHMAFHFPVMPRLFMAIHREDRFPIVDIIEQTPAIPPVCQWAMFLRNHDELTLEMVTDEERDYMYRAYANDSRARINLGIRRRLAPLLSNNRRRIELMNGLLFSLPGTPVLYYGDEIGMGDNIYLGDRNGVRTPMQWSADRNAGFSRANPQKLFLPVIIDPEYHFEAVNVEAQQNNPHSLLWWVKRLIDMRKGSRALSRGSLDFLHPENRKVLAFLRTLDDERVLVVANLSRFVQAVELDLSAYAGATPIELFGGTRLPVVGTAPYFLTLMPHSFLWMRLAAAATSDPCPTDPERWTRLPTLQARDSWLEIPQRDEEEFEEVLASYQACQAPKGSASRGVVAVRVRDWATIRLAGDDALWLSSDAQLLSGEIEHLPLVVKVVAPDAPEEALHAARQAAIARVEGKPSGLLVDATLDPALATFIVELAEANARVPTREGAHLVGTRIGPQDASEAWLAPDVSAAPAVIKGTHTNALFNVGNRLLVKVLRRVEEGLHPEVEFGRFLARKGSDVPVARLLGTVERRAPRGGSIALATIHEFVPSEADGWRFTLDALGDYFERIVTQKGTESPPAGVESNASLDELLGEYLDWVRLLARRTAGLHAALASDPDDPQFAPEEFTPLYQRSLYQSLRGQALHALDAVRRHLPELSPADRQRGEALLAHRGDILQGLHRVLAERIDAARIRTHGDYHLGQVLFTGKDFVVVDFEGNARAPLGERQIKRSPLKDAASMMRSFDFVARSALSDVSTFGPTPGAVRPADLPLVSAWTGYWIRRVSDAFFEAYAREPSIAPLLPQPEASRRILLERFALEWTLLELDHALQDRSPAAGMYLESALELIGERPQ